MSTKPKRDWQAALGQLQLELPRASFDTWVRDAELLAYEDGVYIIGVQNAYAREWLENRLTSTVKKVLTGIVGRTVEVRFVVWQGPQEVDDPEPVTEAGQVSFLAEPEPNSTLDSRLTFASFVATASNRMALAAATAVVENPGGLYNPLVVYGGPGKGKTHLLHAVGNALFGRRAQVLYVTAETFVNDLVLHIRASRTEDFRDKYRRAVLLLDDIQFFVGKKASLGELLNTLNGLFERGLQVVLASQRDPKKLGFDEELLSRLGWGMVVEIRPLSFDDRMEILTAKAEGLGEEFPYGALETIALSPRLDVRGLEHALKKAAFHARTFDLPLTREVVEGALQSDIFDYSNAGPEQITALVSEKLGVSAEEIRGPGRSRHLFLARSVAMFLIREETDLTLAEIGQLFGDRDHTTVMNGCGKIVGRIEIDKQFEQKVEEIRRMISSSKARV